VLSFHQAFVIHVIQILILEFYSLGGLTILHARKNVLISRSFLVNFSRGNGPVGGTINERAVYRQIIQ